MLTIDNGPGHGSPLTDGARAVLPAVVAYVPFGLIVGAHVATSADPLVAWLGTFTIYGGAAQLALLDVLAAGGSVLAAAVTALLLQARLAVYSAALAPDWRAAPLRARLLAAVPSPTSRGRSRRGVPRNRRRGVASSLLPRRRPDAVGGAGRSWSPQGCWAERCWPASRSRGSWPRSCSLPSSHHTCASVGVRSPRSPPRPPPS